MAVELSMKHIRMERDGAVGVITIDRRERFNSLDVEAAQDFRRRASGTPATTRSAPW